MSLFIRELSLYKKVLTLSLRVWTSTTLSNSLSRGFSLFLRVQTLRYRVIESHSRGGGTGGAGGAIAPPTFVILLSKQPLAPPTFLIGSVNSSTTNFSYLPPPLL